MLRQIRSTFRTLSRFNSDSRGTSGIEFAMILPVMVILYVGCVEVSDSVSNNRKVAAVASAVGDLAAQSANLSDGEINDIFDAATAIIAPYSAAPLEMVLTGVAVDNNGNARVAWSEARGRTEYSENSTFPLPNRLAQPNTFHVVSEVDYKYTPLLQSFIGGPITLSETFYLRPRRSTQISRSS
ncbi:MAG: TadE/TadG family type IV pilus assembly protein [Pseudomonadota bacterium]